MLAPGLDYKYETLVCVSEMGVADQISESQSQCNLSIALSPSSPLLLDLQLWMITQV